MGPAPKLPPFPPNDHEPTIVQVNLGLKWRHLMAGAAALGTVVTGLTTAGWLALPAKQQELRAVELRLDTVQVELRTQQDMTAKLIQAVDRLNTTVESIRVIAPLPQPKARGKR